MTPHSVPGVRMIALARSTISMKASPRPTHRQRQVAMLICRPARRQRQSPGFADAAARALYNRRHEADRRNGRWTQPGAGPSVAEGAAWSDALVLSPAEWTAVALSLKVATVGALTSLPFGVAVAWLLARRRFPGK